MPQCINYVCVYRWVHMEQLSMLGIENDTELKNALERNISPNKPIPCIKCGKSNTFEPLTTVPSTGNIICLSMKVNCCQLYHYENYK